MKSWIFFLLSNPFYLFIKTAFLISFFLSCKHGLSLEEEQTLINTAEEAALETQRVLKEMEKESKKMLEIFKSKGPMDPKLLSSIQKIKELAILTSESSRKVVKNAEKSLISKKSIQQSKLVSQKALQLLKKTESIEKSIEDLKNINIKKISEEKNNDNLESLFESIMSTYHTVKKLIVYIQTAANLPVTDILISN